MMKKIFKDKKASKAGKEKNKEGILSEEILKYSRKTGKLNLSDQELVTWPVEIFKLGIIETDTAETDIGSNDISCKWWEMEPLMHLDLSSNYLKDIPTTIHELVSLNVLLLQQNMIDSLPRELGQLTHLTKLDLAHNRIHQFPQELRNLKLLRYLNLSDNLFETFPTVLYDLIMLNYLDFSKNKIVEMAPGIGFLSKLQHLNLSQNKLQSVPSDITTCREIKFLDLSNNKITSRGLPELIDMNFELLLLHYNQLVRLPRLRGCTKLKEIHLGFNRIEEVTIDELSTLAHLQVINLRNNSLKKLPKEFACLQNLVRLDLSHNDLKDLPATLSLLPHLEGLLVEGNALRTIRRDILLGGTGRLLAYLKGLLPTEEIEKDYKNRFPCTAEAELPNRFSMRSSRSVNLSSKELYEIPDSVFEEAANVPCSIVDLSKNKLPSVPKGVWLLSKTITDLNLSRNRLTEMPPEIGTCLGLRFLNVANNLLTTLPIEFSSCTLMRELNVSFNKLQKVPECVYHFTALDILNMCDNKITFLNGEKFLNLKALAVLDLSNNDLTNVPPVMGKMKALSSFKLDGNGLRALRPATLAKGTEAILAWLRDKIVET